MRRTAPLVAPIAALLLAACTGGGGATPVPSIEPADPATFWLRASRSQALPPDAVFGWQPEVLVTGDGRWVTQGPVLAVYPGPLLPNLRARTIPDEGRAAIVARARELGLLGGGTDFLGGAGMPGMATGRIEIVVGGTLVALVGDPAAETGCAGSGPCSPPAGSPAAFAEFWRLLGDLASWIPGLGEDLPWTPHGYAILVGDPPLPDPVLPQPVADWPLEVPVGEFGRPVGGALGRCGTVVGADADRITPALAAANQLTPWVDGLESSRAFGLRVRPIAAGEDPCTEVFGAR